jgi:hypothetical protein
MRSIVCILAVLFALVSPTSFAETNLAQGKPVFTSSVDTIGPSFPAANAVDGSSATRWASARKDGEWIYVDLGSRIDVSRVVINWEAAFAKNYSIDVSDDAKIWLTVYMANANADTRNEINLVHPVGRYLRISCLVRATSYGFSIFELEVYGVIPTLPVSTFVPVKPIGYPEIDSNCTGAKWDTVSPRGGNFVTERAVIAWLCSDGWVWQPVAFAGVLQDRLAEISSAWFLARLLHDRTKLEALSLKPAVAFTDAEEALIAQLTKEINPPPLWVVKANAPDTKRPAYKLLADGSKGAQVGYVATLQACDCKKRFVNSSSTYCGVAGLANIGTTAKLDADAISICAKP